jgi:NADH-quinone oxidoreductase subunit I
MKSSSPYSFKQYILDILIGAKSLIVGMIVTAKRLFKPIITVQYPYQKLTMTPNFRGHIEFIKFDDTRTHHCVACGLCARICPSHVIKLQGEKEKAGSKKVGRRYVIDFSKCSHCGLCVDVCPEQTLKFSREYELVFFERWDTVINLMARLEEKP